MVLEGEFISVVGSLATFFPYFAQLDVSEKHKYTLPSYVWCLIALGQAGMAIYFGHHPDATMRRHNHHISDIIQYPHMLKWMSIFGSVLVCMCWALERYAHFAQSCSSATRSQKALFFVRKVLPVSLTLALVYFGIGYAGRIMRVKSRYLKFVAALGMVCVSLCDAGLFLASARYASGNSYPLVDSIPLMIQTMGYLLIAVSLFVYNIADVFGFVLLFILMSGNILNVFARLFARKRYGPLKEGLSIDSPQIELDDFDIYDE